MLKWQAINLDGLTLMAAGAYNDLWSKVHMQPEVNLQAQLDIRSKAVVPIRNGTIDPALAGWYEPLERIHRLAR
ncbi:hypothetical protein FCL40_00225 [Ferrimonas sediminicola]|uniref:Uncharacterized protein n=1 Tax=Ferrimonas sediminicola TaxID=2569538 RepID=A0A4U1BKA1_9GAMM|nr:hypothetical protein [Ferrimonas sediminicola]TKB51017.1 hypothetical protein FCL40_00225 [Ferrimonas sediminicola]